MIISPLPVNNFLNLEVEQINEIIWLSLKEWVSSFNFQV